jgi:hypothetical protein
MKLHHSRIYLLTVLSILIMGLWSPSAQASPISYSFYGGYSSWEYTAAAIPIDDVNYNITLVADTSGIQNLGSGLYINPVISATITLTGADIQTLFNTPSVTGTFLLPLEMFADNGTIGFGVTGVSDLLNYIAQGTELDTYALSYLDPILGSIVFTDVFNTDIGDLAYNAAGVPGIVDHGFTAAVPIPAAVWLLGSGLIGLVGLRRRMRK